jgi:hypothetical protein
VIDDTQAHPRCQRGNRAESHVNTDVNTTEQTTHTEQPMRSAQSVNFRWKRERGELGGSSRNACDACKTSIPGSNPGGASKISWVHSGDIGNSSFRRHGGQSRAERVSILGGLALY